MPSQHSLREPAFIAADVRPDPDQEARVSRQYQKYAWVLLLLMGGLYALFGASYIILGSREDPAVHDRLRNASPQLVTDFNQIARDWGIFELGFGLFVVAVTLLAYRHGQRWSWFVLWLLPLACLGDLLNAIAAHKIIGPLPIFLVIALLGLLMPARQFLSPSQPIDVVKQRRLPAT